MVMLCVNKQISLWPAASTLGQPDTLHVPSSANTLLTLVILPQLMLLESVAARVMNGASFDDVVL
jgi:hypothetical protein